MYTTGFFAGHAGNNQLAGTVVWPAASNTKSLLSLADRTPQGDTPLVDGGGYGQSMAVPLAKRDHRGRIVTTTPARTITRRQVRPFPIPVAQQPRQTTMFGRPLLATRGR